MVGELLEVRNDMRLPSRSQSLKLQTADGKQLVGQLTLPLDTPATATMLMLHPLPTHGGSSDSHVYRKAVARLPAMAQIATLTINTRGTTSSLGTSTGNFDHARSERFDVAALIEYAEYMNLPNLWVVGWSFGADLALMYGCDPALQGAVLLSPPLRFVQPWHLSQWEKTGQPVVALVPEFDDYLRPEQARPKFAAIPQAKIVAGVGAKHLWVGETAVRQVLNYLVQVVAPEKYPLPVSWPAEQVLGLSDVD